MMLLTLDDVLAMDVCRRGRPRVVAGAAGLGAPVRWVHAVELTDVGRLLRGGELVLSTGIALPDEGPLLAAYVAELADAGIAGLAVELGRRYAGALPDALVSAAEKAGVPLIAFEREVPFVEITEAVHARIIDSQLAELRASERLHEVFTELSVAGATADEIVRQAAALAGRPVMLADLAHRVLACAPAGADPGPLLDGFARRSRAVPVSGRTTYSSTAGWLVTPVGARGEDWGRVVLVCDGPPAPNDTVLIERAATTLALGRLLTRHQESLERQAHRTLISGIIAASHADPAEAGLRARALGVPVDGRRLLGVVLMLGEVPGVPGISAHARVLEAADVLAAACRAERVPALVGTLDDVRAGAMLSLPAGAEDDLALSRIAAAVHDRLAAAVIGVGGPAASIRDVRRSFLEADQVASASSGGRLFYRLPDLHLRGLLHLLREDARLQTFTERELGPLLADDRASELAGVLRAYLEAGGNKAAAAARSHLARPTFYERLRRIERVLGVDLASPEVRTSLHVALLAYQAAGAGMAGPPTVLLGDAAVYGAPDEPDVIGDGGEPGWRRRSVTARPLWLRLAGPFGERAERVFARRSWLTAGCAAAAAAAAGTAVVLSLTAPATPQPQPQKGPASPVPPLLITTAMAHTVGPDGVFAWGKSGSKQWRLAVQDIADPGYPCMPGVTVNGSDAEPLLTGRQTPTPIGDPAFVTLGSAMPGTGFAFMQVNASVSVVWPDAAGSPRIPAVMQPAAVSECGRTFHLVGFAYRLATRLRLHTGTDSWLVPASYSDPVATLQFPQVAGIWQDLNPVHAPAESGQVGAGTVSGQPWSVRVTLSVRGDCFGLDTGLLGDTTQQSTAGQTYCAPVSTPAGLDAIVAFPDPGGQGCVYAVSVGAATARIRLTLAGGQTGSASVRVVAGRRFAAFAVTAPARLIRLTLIGAAGQVAGSATALPADGYLQFQP